MLISVRLILVGLWSHCCILKIIEVRSGELSNKTPFYNMKNLIKNFEEQITFLQQEVSQMSNELYSQQKEIVVLKKQIINLIKRIEELDNGIELDIIKQDKKPPHY